MKALTLYQPWAELVAAGLKRYETRSWWTPHLGLIAIHAAGGAVGRATRLAIEGSPAWGVLRASGDLRSYHELPSGVIVAVARLSSCRLITSGSLPTTARERHVGDWTPGRWAWQLDDVTRVSPPLPFRGRRRLWEVPAEVEAEVLRRVRAMGSGAVALSCAVPAGEVRRSTSPGGTDRP